MISGNLHRIKAEIEEICLKTGRNPASVTLVAVSKLHPIIAIREAYAASQADFGENYAQEFRNKYAELGNTVRWHFIGHLQTNKVKYVAGKATLIHTVDSEKIALEINKTAAKLGVVQDVLFEVNTSGELAKQGLTSKDNVFALTEFCNRLANLKARGLMTMAPLTGEPAVVRPCFTALRGLLEELNRSGAGMTELSMGMSNDFAVAIEEGATLLRIGTAVFGERTMETL